jgi:hypothetical protein
MAVFREISIPFGGKEYVVTPSNKVLRRIEMKGRREDPAFNLVAVFYRATSMSGGFYDLAFVLAELINSAGGSVGDDDALAEFMAIQDAKELSSYIALICSCVMPEPKAASSKKSEGAEMKAA